MMNALWRAGAVTGALLLLTLLSCGEGEVASTIVVDSTADTDNRDGVVTLREAILLASGELAVAELDAGEADNVSKQPGAESSDTIIFDPSVFPASDGDTISLTAPLPALSTGLDSIDGSQASVTIDGVKQTVECIVISSNDNAVKGLSIKNCLVGVTIQPGAQGNEIGGAGPGEGNVISANDQGVLIGAAGANGNVVKGNYVGTDAAGTAALGNRLGIVIDRGAEGNVVGGSSPEERNIISSNSGVGVVINGSRNVVKGNYIGTDVTGTVSLANRMEGIWLPAGAENNIIGGPSPGDRNLLSGNDLFGVSMSGEGTRGNVVIGNYIGVDATGTAPLKNLVGVVIDRGAQGNTIGGTGAGEGNLISANNDAGVLIRGLNASSNAVLGNQIGVDATGSQLLGNGNGVWVLESAQGNAIGGPAADEANVIVGSVAFGVLIEGSETVGNTVRGNSIFSNRIEAIKNKDGGNAELAPPTIDSVGPVEGSACPNCTVDIYSDSGAEGQVYEGSVVADADGRFSFGASVSGPNITATATDASGNTSAFSQPARAPIE